MQNERSEKMIELNIKYSTKQLAEALEITYGSFRNSRKEYETHLTKFYNYEIIKKGNTTYYNFLSSMYEYIPYKEYKAMQKSKILQKHIHKTIEQDKRQTGSNIARIIIVDGEIQALDLKLSTLTVYVRDELHELITSGYYTLTDYQWCYLDKQLNKYVLMTEEAVKELRSYFNSKDFQDLEENVLSAMEQGTISQKAGDTTLTNLRKDNFIQGRKQFQKKYGHWPMKVPVYERCAFEDEEKQEDKEKEIETFDL